MGEHTFFLSFFIFFFLENRKTDNRSLRRFLSPSRRFLRSLHSSRYGSLRLSLRAATSSARPPQRGPRPRSGLHSPSLQTPRPFAPSVAFATKSRSGSKKVFENEPFFCSLGRKKRQKERIVVYLYMSKPFFPI